MAFYPIVFFLSVKNIDLLQLRKRLSIIEQDADFDWFITSALATKEHYLKWTGRASSSTIVEICKTDPINHS